MGFTSKLQGRQILTCCTFLQFKLNIYLLQFSKYKTKSIKIFKFDEKRAITPRWVIRFTSKWQGRWILLCLSFFPHVRFLFLLTVFELLPKNYNFTRVLFRHGGHDGWSAGSSDTTFKGNPLRMIQAKFGLNWPSGFREDFFISLQTDDGRQVIQRVR